MTNFAGAIKSVPNYTPKHVCAVLDDSTPSITMQLPNPVQISDVSISGWNDSPVVVSISVGGMTIVSHYVLKGTCGNQFMDLGIVQGDLLIDSDTGDTGAIDNPIFVTLGYREFENIQ